MGSKKLELGFANFDGRGHAQHPVRTEGIKVADLFDDRVRVERLETRTIIPRGHNSIF